VLPQLVEGTGLRDRGDYRRSGDVVTNLELSSVHSTEVIEAGD
jgi:hypothetical protein